MYDELETVKAKLGATSAKKFELTMENNRLSSENECFKKETERLKVDLTHYSSMSKAALKKLEVLKRENMELESMRNHEALKYQMDNEHCH